MNRINSEEGLSEVIGFIMILALIMIFLSIWVIYVVPADGRQQEIEHMGYVQDWFTQYKITADSLWINYNPATGEGPKGVTLSNSLVLGSQGGATYSQGLFLFFMRPFGSSGTISLENGSEWFEISNSSGILMNEEIGSVQYKGMNNYWIPQTYYYELGGVFLKQSDGTVNRVAPTFSFSPNGQTATLVLVNLDMGGSGTTSISGEGQVRIDTLLNDSTEENIFEPVLGDPYTINLTLRDESSAKAWRSIIRELGGNANLTGGNRTTVTNLDEIHYWYANYTVSLQSVAATFT
ncbi:DUF7289 family protein [Methanolacinia paynteri]|uniref:DUF7289 family protein n=1 Tax=Methanolacinia paynteri TaxID=230356 RepID=UPI00064EA711|nr:hypothetical protein [Methanolacinia paynteri]